MLRTILAALLFAAIGAAQEPPLPASEPAPAGNATQPDPEDLAELLEPIREARRLPALAAAVVRDGRIVARGATGVRKLGAEPAVLADDRFHLGSCTKAMTATLVAILVERGDLAWDASIESVMPELARDLRPAYRSVTVAQLLAHRGGFDHTVPHGSTIGALHRLAGSIPEQRLAYARLMGASDPVVPPGGTMRYSNAGYVVAAVLAEHVTGRSWEELMRTLVFTPLGMTTAGFGPMAGTGSIDQPWSHACDDGTLRPLAPTPHNDNPAMLGPAGRVHASISDWARFVAAHLEGRTGDGPLLKQATFERLHRAPEGGDYALGWAVTSRPWAGGEALTHAGSNTLNFAVAWLAPARRFGVVIAANAGGPDATAGCDEAAGALLRRFGPR